MDNNTRGVKGVLTASRSFAQSLGGDLVVYSSDEEAQAIKDFGSNWFNNIRPSQETISAAAGFDVCAAEPDFRLAITTGSFEFVTVAIGLFLTVMHSRGSMVRILH